MWVAKLPHGQRQRHHKREWGVDWVCTGFTATNSTIERIGFITNENLDSLGVKNGKILVYLPHSYAFSGQLFVVDRSYITLIDKSSAEIMKLIVSGGVTELDNSSEKSL